LQRIGQHSSLGAVRLRVTDEDVAQGGSVLTGF
jgi:hypothetical protein